MALDGLARKGSSILIQKGAVTIGGMRTKSWTVNSETVDITSADDTNRWRQLLAATGVKNMSISASGVLKDTAALQAVMTDVVAQTLDTYTLTVPGVGTFTGLFQISSYEGGGEFNAEATYGITLESGGDITFTAEG